MAGMAGVAVCFSFAAKRDARHSTGRLRRVQEILRDDFHERVGGHGADPADVGGFALTAQILAPGGHGAGIAVANFGGAGLEGLTERGSGSALES